MSLITAGAIQPNELHLCAGNILSCLSSIFVNGSCAKLQRVDPSFLCHFILQQGIDHSMPCGLRLGFESVRSDNHPIVELLSELVLEEGSKYKPEMGLL